ncbi:glycerate kinase [Mycolicibacterium holsaticum]|uniref:glycerate kinase n=1 Tax=Mycolicibacterium holsaticum TaxID=152142 RepID=UPI001C7D8945|nr:glycerate kinase [Mycolicibacterium holsaticum]QZA10890.1 glycerate kinase [Mycolicibacterium holsaticum DSM 44478 = JCM 12374]UNC11610.1 glycerate kinase [Mycolicibacterium holsaticum DSM 44478 = JCM 12374]
MKIVLAPDSFKESLTASQAVAAMRAGVQAVLPEAECVEMPMADGGEGTVEAVVNALHGQRVEALVHDALGRPVTATYGYVPLRQLAVIEVAAAAGLELIPPGQRDVLRASSFGVGQLIRSGLDRGAEDFLIGLGGSATNDGGAGMLVALGAVMADAAGGPLEPGGAALQRLDRIDIAGLDRRLRDVRIRVASDVTAPLLGPTGASAVFGPQKGAGPADVTRLDAALSRLAAVTATTLGRAQPQRQGAGAAGGLGFALAEFLDADIRPGVEEVARTVGLERALRGADWVFTGEGSVDAQTVMGKTPFGVAQLAATAGARVVIFAGRVAPDASVLLDYGVDRLVAITAEATPIEQALRDGATCLTRATAEVCREIAG